MLGILFAVISHSYHLFFSFWAKRALLELSLRFGLVSRVHLSRTCSPLSDSARLPGFPRLPFVFVRGSSQKHPSPLFCTPWERRNRKTGDHCMFFELWVTKGFFGSRCS